MPPRMQFLPPGWYAIQIRFPLRFDRCSRDISDPQKGHDSNSFESTSAFASSFSRRISVCASKYVIILSLSWSSKTRYLLLHQLHFVHENIIRANCNTLLIVLHLDELAGSISNTFATFRQIVCSRSKSTESVIIILFCSNSIRSITIGSLMPLYIAVVRFSLNFTVVSFLVSAAAQHTPHLPG